MELIDNIPGNLSFDKSENLLVRKNDKDYLHTIPNTNAKYALNLVELGTPEALQRAEKVIEAVLKCQELDEKNKHFGNFFWEKEDEFVEEFSNSQNIIGKGNATGKGQYDNRHETK